MLRTAWILLLLLTLQGAALSANGWSLERGSLLPSGIAASIGADCSAGKDMGEAPSHGDAGRHCCLACFAGAADEADQIAASSLALVLPLGAPATLGKYFSWDAPFRIFSRPRSASPRSPPHRS
ncbi:hypothetical protein [Methylocystis echinoides]|uniref:hypothetical protein n=1 Tax=Methylocystis echinoides TaxID=29468 RepID=UPI00342CE563